MKDSWNDEWEKDWEAKWEKDFENEWVDWVDYSIQVINALEQKWCMAIVQLLCLIIYFTHLMGGFINSNYVDKAINNNSSERENKCQKLIK